MTFRAKRPHVDRPEIALSWHRSELAGLTPDRVIKGDAEDFDSASRLLHAAGPVLERLSEDISGMRAGGLLADQDARIVASYFGDTSLAAATEAVGACPGMRFDEETSGTNAIATSFETREAVHVHTDEHFLEIMRDFSCYGAPIVNPLTGRLEGVLDFMATPDTDPQLMKVTTENAVRAIIERLLDGFDPDVLHSLAAFKAIARRTDDAVVLFGRDFVLCSEGTFDMIGPVDLNSLSDIAQDLATGDCVMELELESGRQVSLRSTRLADAGSILLRAREGERSRAVVVPRQGASPISQNSRLVQRLDDLAARKTSTLVLGEPGAGRTWASLRLTAEGDVQCYHGTDFREEDDIEFVRSRTGPVVIENAGALPAAARHAVAQMVTAGRRIILTADTGETSRENLSYLGSLFAEWVELPPLRERLDDLGEISADLLEQLCDGRRRTLSARALRVLKTHDWPGHLNELAIVLRHALDEAPPGRLIDVTDLPTRYQTPRHSRPGLTPIEQAERHVVESTLNACGGNKAQTARQLGISRSKLYDRLRYFQIG